MLFLIAEDNVYICTDREVYNDIINDDEYNVVFDKDGIANIFGTGWWYQHFCMTDGFHGTVEHLF